MILSIDHHRFELAHRAFREHMLLKSGGEPFTSFAHPFLFSDEIEYKCKLPYEAVRLLRLDKWENWRKTPGKILQASGTFLLILPSC